jgi:hypothetical protein
MSSILINHCTPWVLPMTVACATAVSIGCQTAHAQTDKESIVELFDSVLVYTAQGADHNLPQLPGSILGEKIKWESSCFNAIALGKMRGTLGTSFALLDDSLLRNVRHGYEVVFAKHHGLQSNYELAAAYTLRSPDLFLGPLAVNAGAGVGLSHAFSRPAYEDGPFDNPTRRYRTQLFIVFEAEWKLRYWEQLSIVTRVHHRSGAYGLIAPRNVGSNFLAVGVRYRF